MHIPVATYRLQLISELSFEKALGHEPAVVSFARRHEGRCTASVVAGRLLTSLAGTNDLPVGACCGSARVAFTGRTLAVEHDGHGRCLPFSKVFAHLPVTILEGL